jgi:hypothetical protein
MKCERNGVRGGSAGNFYCGYISMAVGGDGGVRLLQTKRMTTKTGGAPLARMMKHHVHFKLSIFFSSWAIFPHCCGRKLTEEMF